MPMVSMPSVEAQNRFGHLADIAQREIVSVTRRGRVSLLVMSPQVLEDYVDAQLAISAEAEGFLSEEESEKFLSSLRNA
jgi:hypothetical protein